MTVNRARLFHQADGHYRSPDDAIQAEKQGKRHDAGGMPIRENAVRGWAEHTFPPIRAKRLRLLITRSTHGQGMGMGEWEVCGPGDVGEST